jgi:hypothetical protein
MVACVVCTVTHRLTWGEGLALALELVLALELGLDSMSAVVEAGMRDAVLELEGELEAELDGELELDVPAELDAELELDADAEADAEAAWLGLLLGLLLGLELADEELVDGEGDGDEDDEDDDEGDGLGDGELDAGSGWHVVSVFVSACEPGCASPWVSAWAMLTSPPSRTKLPASKLTAAVRAGLKRITYRLSTLTVWVITSYSLCSEATGKRRGMGTHIPRRGNLCTHMTPDRSSAPDRFSPDVTIPAPARFPPW